MYCSWGNAFDGSRLWNFCNEYAQNVGIFIVGNDSFRHSENVSNNVLVLVERPTDDINEKKW